MVSKDFYTLGIHVESIKGLKGSLTIGYYLANKSKGKRFILHVSPKNIKKYLDSLDGNYWLDYLSSKDHNYFEDYLKARDIVRLKIVSKIEEISRSFKIDAIFVTTDIKKLLPVRVCRRTIVYNKQDVFECRVAAQAATLQKWRDYKVFQKRIAIKYDIYLSSFNKNTFDLLDKMVGGKYAEL